MAGITSIVQWLHSTGSFWLLFFYLFEIQPVTDLKKNKKQTKKKSERAKKVVGSQF